MGNSGQEMIEWLVLDKQKDKVLVISNKCLDCQPYHTEREGVTWETCSLRAWLNSTFINEAFTADEQTLIVPTTVKTTSDQKDVDGGNDTTDQIFLLSSEEAEQYFPSNEERQSEATLYAMEQGAYVNDKNQYNWWWLRSPGFSNSSAKSVDYNGEISQLGSTITRAYTVRPVMWLDISSAAPQSPAETE